MTLGQRAMVAAKILFLKNKTQEELSKAVKIARPTIAKASTVLEYGKDLVDQVIDGTMPLNKAYEDALARKRKAGSLETRLNNLRENAPDLAAQVVDGTLALGEAQAAWHARTVMTAQSREGAQSIKSACAEKGENRGEFSRAPLRSYSGGFPGQKWPKRRRTLYLSGCARVSAPRLPGNTPFNPESLCKYKGENSQRSLLNAKQQLVRLFRIPIFNPTFLSPCFCQNSPD